MRKIKIIAREKIINPSTRTIHSDEGLRALDAYREEVLEINENYNEDSVIEMFEEKYPEVKCWNLEIKEID